MSNPDRAKCVPSTISLASGNFPLFCCDQGESAFLIARAAGESDDNEASTSEDSHEAAEGIQPVIQQNGAAPQNANEDTVASDLERPDLVVRESQAPLTAERSSLLVLDDADLDLMESLEIAGQPDAGSVGHTPGCVLAFIRICEASPQL